MYCPRCNNELPDGSDFCRFCGATLDQGSDIQEEQDFLDKTHRLLRWERKAWSIAGKAFLILGIIFVALYGLMALILLSYANGSDLAGAVHAFYGTLFSVYAIVLGGTYIAIGIVGMVCCNKVTRYMDTMYTDFLPTRNRCTSIGMIVLGAMFNTIAMIFYIINFVRMKSCGHIINRILSRQAKNLPSNY